MSEASAVSAWDITDTGQARAAHDTVPEPAQGTAWRWLHFDRSAPGFATWATQHLPPLAATSLMETETRPRADLQTEGLLLTLRGINLNPGADADDMVALRLWVTPHTVVSARRRRIFAAEELREQMHNGQGPSTPARFLIALTTALMTRIDTASQTLEDQTDLLEEAFLGQDFDQADRLAGLRARAIKLRRHIAPQREALARLAILPDTYATAAERQELAEIANRGTRVVEELDAITARLHAMQDQLNTRNAELLARNGFVLSVVAAIFLPLGFLTGLFGVNVGGMPGMDSSLAFWVLTAATVVIGLALWALFRFLRWF